jgi:isoquinoline 1-oxidoreductase
MDPLALAQVATSEMSVAARIYLNEDGTITALSGKVEEGQGPRAELTQAAAEELRVSVDRVRLTMADTDLVPDDGITAGSRTTPRNIPEMRQAAATARELLTRLAAKQWSIDENLLEIRGGKIGNPRNGQTMTYADLARSKDLVKAFTENVRPDVALAPMGSWEVLGQSVPRPNNRDLVTGAHRFPSDIVRPNMLYGRVLRPPSFGATLEAIDLSEAEAMNEVFVVRDDQFVGFAATSLHLATQALDAAARTASWKESRQPVTNRTLHAHLKDNERKERARVNENGSTERGFAAADKVVSETYTLAYVQHAPMEPRAAVAEWTGDKLTVWAGCDGPFRAQNALVEEFGLTTDQVRVIIPDMGGGFGGKHTAEAALEAARMAKTLGRPVWVRWTREEEFTWAYSRPGAVIECKGGLKADGSLSTWEFTNINAGGSAIDTPYEIPNTRITSVGSDSPLRQGAYRCLAATGNNFARESFMDELAATAGSDPLEFRLAHLENERLRAVLEEAAGRFNWKERKKRVNSELGVGLACGTEKNSVVAACVAVAIDPRLGRVRVLEVCEAFECGPVLNPANLTSQVQGCIVMGLGGALTEEMEFENGRILNPSFGAYRVPRFRDVPRIGVHLINNPDIPPAGGGETPIIAVAPAIGNAIFAATGVRIRSMPMGSHIPRRS